MDVGGGGKVHQIARKRVKWLEVQLGRINSRIIVDIGGKKDFDKEFLIFYVVQIVESVNQFSKRLLMVCNNGKRTVKSNNKVSISKTFTEIW